MELQQQKILRGAEEDHETLGNSYSSHGSDWVSIGKRSLTGQSAGQSTCLAT